MLVLAACTYPSVSVAGSDNAVPVRAAYDGFAAGNIAAVTAQMSPDIIWNEAEGFTYADGNPYIGPEAVVGGVFARLGAEWVGFAATPVKFIKDGNTIAVLGRYTATNKATGKPLDAQFTHVWTVEKGKITRFQQYTDTAQWMSVMGE
ncbi:MAG: DUF4440 domain-containing protein [Robiginitomaculum sp.]|nr:MAG: DUF4440 domain-containing protein [Robiginitomaculum sp.]